MRTSTVRASRSCSPAPVPVPDEGRDRDAEEGGAEQGAEEVGAAGVEGEDAEAEEALARGEADRADREDAQDEEDEERPVAGRTRLVAVGDQAVCDQQAQTPVDDEGAEAAAGTGDRTGALLGQTELFAAVTEVDTCSLRGLAGPGEP